MENLFKLNQEKVQKHHERYTKALDVMLSDISIDCLCLPVAILNILKRNNLTRIVDVAEADLTKIKGLGQARIAILRYKISDFVSML